MRNSTEICLLCESNPSDATNSHIIPKFMSKTILGLAGPKKAFSLSTLNPFKKQKPAQDTPKENYLLCSSCEKSLGVIERIIANEIHSAIENDSTESYTTQEINEDEKAIIFTSTNPLILRLLIYSILFRCHISNLDFFRHFVLEEKEFDFIKSLLKKTIKPSQTDFLNNLNTINESEFDINIPFLLVTSKNHTQPTENIIFHIPAVTDPYLIYMSKYSLVISMKKKAFSSNNSLLNIGNAPSTIMDISAKHWDIQNGQVIGLLKSVIASGH